MTDMGTSTVERLSDGYWEHFHSSAPVPYQITGKYLFFSRDRDALIAVALEELTHHGFHHAKTHGPDVTPPSGDYVLCLYYSGDERKLELRDRYAGRADIRYCFWKSDQATLQRKYSRGFLAKLSSEEAEHFQPPKKPSE